MHTHAHTQTHTYTYLDVLGVSFKYLISLAKGAICHLKPWGRVGGPAGAEDDSASEMAPFRGVLTCGPTGCVWPRMVMNAAEHKIVNLL